MSKVAPRLMLTGVRTGTVARSLILNGASSGLSSTIRGLNQLPGVKTGTEAPRLRLLLKSLARSFVQLLTGARRRAGVVRAAAPVAVGVRCWARGQPVGVGVCCGDRAAGAGGCGGCGGCCRGTRAWRGEPALLALLLEARGVARSFIIIGVSLGSIVLLQRRNAARLNNDQ